MIHEPLKEIERLQERVAKLEAMLLRSMEMQTELLALASPRYILVPK